MEAKDNAVRRESPRRGSQIRRTVGSGDGNTRQRILNAAKKIFSLHAFKAATTRMIAQEAGVDHPLIHYHFGSKEMLFEQIAGEMYEEFGRAHRTCFEGLPLDRPREGLSLYLGRLLDYCVKNPEQLQLILLNIAQIGRLEEIPGYRFIRMHLDRIRETFRETVRLQASREEVDRFILCFHSLVISFVGARSCQAQVLGMDPESRDYLEWIKEALLVIFLPQLERMMLPDDVPG
jgi:TetR/AcrR family transcriptional regulator